MRTRLGLYSFACVLLVAGLAGCRPDTSAIMFDGEKTHANGLVMSVPKGFAVVQTERGFDLAQTGNRRSPLQMSLMLLRPSPDDALAQSWFTFSWTDKAVIRQLGDPGDPVGSGGAEFIFVENRALGHCWLSISASDQSEGGAPSFIAARAVLEKAGATGC
jgi:hypothetical protein